MRAVWGDRWALQWTITSQPLTPASDRKQHAWACPRAKIPCTHARRGCAAIIPRADLSSHLRNCIYEQLVPYFAKQEAEVARINERAEHIQQEFRALQAQVQASSRPEYPFSTPPLWSEVPLSIDGPLLADAAGVAADLQATRESLAQAGGADDEATTPTNPITDIPTTSVDLPASRPAITRVNTRADLDTSIAGLIRATNRLAAGMEALDRRNHA